MKLTALILFVSAYVLILLFPKFRAASALCAAGLFVLFRVLTPAQAFAAIDCNVLLTLAGLMGLVSLFVRSGAPAWFSDKLVQSLPSAKRVFVVLALFSGLVSAFIDNVATVLMVAPIGLAVSKKLGVSPVPALLAIAVSSNLQGAATLVGDTTSILLGESLGLEFTDFFVMSDKPGLFFIVQAGMLATLPVLLFLFRKDTASAVVAAGPPVRNWLPTVLMFLTVAALVAASFIPEKPAVTNGLICFGFFVLGLLAACLRERSAAALHDALSSFDLATLLLLSGLFVIVEGIVRAGIVADISAVITSLGGGNLFLTYSLIVWASVFLSAFIDNIPYVAAMLPVVGSVSRALGVDTLPLCFGLLAGATLGGNLTPVGASANIAAIGLLRREGYRVSTLEFMRVGVPFTFAAVLTGYLLIWLIYA